MLTMTGLCSSQQPYCTFWTLNFVRLRFSVELPQQAQAQAHPRRWAAPPAPHCPHRASSALEEWIDFCAGALRAAMPASPPGQTRRGTERSREVAHKRTPSGPGGVASVCGCGVRPRGSPAGPERPLARSTVCYRTAEL